MKCDELTAYKGDVTIPVYGTIADAEVYLKEEADKVIAEKNKTIAELQKTNVQLASSCVMLNKLLDTREEEVNTLKQKLESVQASMYCDVVDAGMDNRRLKRALWMSRAATARNMRTYEALDNYTRNHPSRKSRWNYISSQRYDCWFYAWDNVEQRCLKKAEEYK